MAPKASGPRKRLGARSIRTRILMIGWVPSLSLLLVGVIVATILAVNFWGLRSSNSVVRDSLSSSQSFIPEARRELLLSAAYIADPSAANKTRLTAQQAKTDQALAKIQADAGSLADKTPPEIGPAFKDFAARLAAMPSMRAKVNDGEATVLEATTFWGGMIDQIAETVRLLATIAPNGHSAIEEQRSASLIGLVEELAEGNGLAYVAFSNEGITQEEYEAFIKTGNAYRDELDTITPDLTPAEQMQVKQLTSSQAWRQQAQVEQAVLDAHVLTEREKKDFTRDKNTGPGAAGDQNGGTANSGDLPAGSLSLSAVLPTNAQLNNGNLKAELPIASSAWENANDEVTTALTNIALLHLDFSSKLAVDAAGDRVNYAIYGGLAAVLFGILIFLITTREGNRLVNRLRGLRDETLDLAQTRLPALVQGLRAGEVDDEHRQMPKLSFGKDEIGEVADAFNRAQEVAVTAAVQEAETRAGLREVFLNIAYRSQVIVHRQLGVLEKAERFEEDPEQIELLFELDHLATRARRNAENLVILGGGQPGRRWRNSVELLQVVRSSISEAQDYARVSIGRLPRLAINGAAVADVIHLLAELVDNATSFSPPMSKVEVRGNLVGKGLVLEIEDQGLGIPAEKLAELNEMLTTAPDFHALTLREEPRLGMFVVAQLAAGQNIRVTLTPSPAYGGTKAVVLIPSELFDANPAGLAGGPALALDGADGAAPESAGARSLHERMAITGEMTGEIAVIPAQNDTQPAGPERRGAAPALSVAPSEPRTATGPLERVTRRDGRGGDLGDRGERPTQLRPIPPVGTGGPAGPGGPVRHAQASYPGEPGPTLNPQARAEYLAGRAGANGLGNGVGNGNGNGNGLGNGNGHGNGGANGNGNGLPQRGLSPSGVGNGAAAKAAPTPPAGMRGAQGARPIGPNGRPELPRRTRQAHLSDRLKSTPAPATAAMPERADTGPQSDPDLARNRMAAFQRGTQRGRTERPDA